MSPTLQPSTASTPRRGDQTPMEATEEDGIPNRLTIELDQISDIPKFIKDQSSILRFPEKLILLIMHVERRCQEHANERTSACISWTDDGEAFIIRDDNEMIRRYFPIFFKKCKFSSFTRKLYRWGFRQKHADKNEQQPCASKGFKIFFHRHFQRDNKALVKQMNNNKASPSEQPARRDSGSHQQHQVAQVDPPDHPSGNILQQHDRSTTTTTNPHLAAADILAFPSYHHHQQQQHHPTATLESGFAALNGRSILASVPWLGSQQAGQHIGGTTTTTTIQAVPIVARQSALLNSGHHLLHSIVLDAMESNFHLPQHAAGARIAQFQFHNPTLEASLQLVRRLEAAEQLLTTDVVLRSLLLRRYFPELFEENIG